MELQKHHPRAGVALLPVFLPGCAKYTYEGLGNEREKTLLETCRGLGEEDIS
jgi:hypothetical protein